MSRASMTLLTAQTSDTSAPSSGSDGVAVVLNGHPDDSDEYLLEVWSTAGSGTMVASPILWGYTATGGWAPLGTHATAATKGMINGGNALGETGTNTIQHKEIVRGIKHCTRVALQMTAIGGTSTAISARLSAYSRTDRD